MASPKLKYGIGNGSSTTSSASITGADTSVGLTSTTAFQGAPVAGEGMILMNEGGASEEIAYSTGISGSSLTIPVANRGLEGGSAQAQSSGVSIKGILSVGMWNDMIQALTNVLVQSSGALDTTKVVDLTTAQTLTNKTLKDSTNIFGNVSDVTKALKFSLGGATTAKTMTIASSHTVDRTITLPDATDTLTGKATTDTLTNKRITKRIVTAADAASITPNSDNADITYQSNTQAAGTLTINADGGTPTNGQLWELWVKSTNAQTASFNAGFIAMGTALPTTFAAGKNVKILFQYDTNTSKWGCLASNTEA